MMIPHYSRTALPIALIFSVRMLGLFMLIPVFTLYADDLIGATPKLIGLALGIYGLTQAMFQIPMGVLSDKIGRKKVIALGLSLFTLGSLIAAFSHSIALIILARALQGTGAVGSTLIALTADLTREEDRTKAMALIGLSIGLSFAVAIVISPPLTYLFHLNGLFLFMALLALLGVLVLYTALPNPKRELFHSDSEPVPQLFKQVLQDKDLLRLDLGIFCQHALLTATFYAIPLLLEHRVSQLWSFYLPILTLGFVGMIPFIIIAEKQHKMKQVFCFAITLSLLAQAGLLLNFNRLNAVFLLLTVYFLGFNILEASLPSLVTKFARVRAKGTAMGIYSTSQFLGIFCGGLMAGYLYHHYSYTGIFIANSLLCLIWLGFALTMQQPKQLTTKIIDLAFHFDNQVLNRILADTAGIVESHYSKSEHALYLKIDKNLCDWERLVDSLGPVTHNKS